MYQFSERTQASSLPLPCQALFWGLSRSRVILRTTPTRCRQPQGWNRPGTTPILRDLSMQMRCQVLTPWGADAAIASVTGVVRMWQMFPERDNCFWWEPLPESAGSQVPVLYFPSRLPLERTGCRYGEQRLLPFPQGPVSWWIDAASALWTLGLLDFWIS